MTKKNQPTAVPQGRPAALNAPTGPRRANRPSANSAISAGTPIATATKT
jgi:hypothetical protein